MKKIPSTSTVHKKSKIIQNLITKFNGMSKDIKFTYGYSGPIYTKIFAFHKNDFDPIYGTFSLNKKLFTIYTEIEFFNMKPEDFNFDDNLLEIINEIIKLDTEIAPYYNNILKIILENSETVSQRKEL